MEEKEKKQELIIKGRLGTDVEYFESEKDKNIKGIKFTLAEKVHGQDQPKWHNVVHWISDKESLDMEKASKKGDYLIIQGYEKTNLYKDGNGVDKTSISFVLTKELAHQSKEVKESVIKGNLGADPQFNEKGFYTFQVGIKKNNEEKPHWQNCLINKEQIQFSGIESKKKGDFVELKGKLSVPTEYNGQISQTLIVDSMQLIEKKNNLDKGQDLSNGGSLMM